MDERGVYVRETFPGLTEIRAVDSQGETVKRVAVLTRYLRERDLAEVRDFLDAVSPPGAVLRLVSAAPAAPVARGARASATHSYLRLAP